MKSKEAAEYQKKKSREIDGKKIDTREKGVFCFSRFSETSNRAKAVITPFFSGNKKGNLNEKPKLPQTHTHIHTCNHFIREIVLRTK